MRNGGTYPPQCQSNWVPPALGAQQAPGFSTSSVSFSLRMDESGKTPSWMWAYGCTEMPATFLDHQKLVWWQVLQAAVVELGLT